MNIAETTKYEMIFWWNQGFGSGHASLSLREDWRNQLLFVKEQLNATYVRFHGLCLFCLSHFGFENPPKNKNNKFEKLREKKQPIKRYFRRRWMCEWNQ